MSPTDKLSLDSLGLPKKVVSHLANIGMKTMFPWQAECLRTGDALDGGNLIYSAPTGAGKTLVADLIALKRVISTGRKAMVILPFVSIAREKTQSLKRLYASTNLKVGGFMGSTTPPGGIEYINVAVCTIERANGIINKLLEAGNLNKLSVVVVDELHMVGDSGRGFLLEPLLTKICYHSLKHSLEGANRIQIIGMSATLPNLPTIADWLSASLYTTNYRPIPLKEYIKIEERLYDSQFQYVRDVQIPYKFDQDEEMIVNLCLETLSQHKSVLIFCPTKAWCETLAWRIAKSFHNLYTKDENGVLLYVENELDKPRILALLDQLKQTAAGVTKNKLHLLISYMCAFHHAGLTSEERDIVETGFKESTIRVLVSTTTLSAGVNLPAQRVIIRSPLFLGKTIDVHTYKQMCGRAGRKGIDTLGESILICKNNEKERVESLLTSDLKPAQSQLVCIDGEGNACISSTVKRCLLEIIASQAAHTVEHLTLYLNCTLKSAELEDTREEIFPKVVEDCLRELKDLEFIIETILPEEGSRFTASQLGKAVFASSLNPDESLLIFSDLNKARKNMVLENDLHVLYLVTPLTANIGNMDWMRFMSLYERLPSDKQRVAELVGVNESSIRTCQNGKRRREPEEQARLDRIHRRFYTALILDDLCNEVPILKVEGKYEMNRGALQSLQKSAATFAGMLTTFCSKLGWSPLKLLMKDIQPRLDIGVRHELIELIQVPSLDARTARHLYDSGIHLLEDLCAKSAGELMDLLIIMLPYESEKKQDGEDDWERRERSKRRVFISGKNSMTVHDAAVTIHEEAKTLLMGGSLLNAD